VSSRPVVLVTEHLSDAPLQWLAERADVVQAPAGSAEFGRAAPDAEGLLVRTYTRVDAALLARLPRLRVAARAGVGLDNIDAAACAARGVAVVNTPDANTQAVVEYVLCLLCDALRPRVYLERAVDPARWNDLRAQTVGHRQMDELQLGVLGMGRIGRRVAQVARAIGMRVAYCDLLEIDPAHRHGAHPVDAAELFRASDVVTVHVDGRASNRGLVGEALLAAMKPDAVLLNTSRGMVVDHAALARRLREAPAMLAVLDVHDPEPVAPDNPLLGLPNARLAPHLASRTDAAMEAMSWVVRDLWNALQRGG
jgi:D-3-phosphoglycerate dehydrogenase